LQIDRSQKELLGGPTTQTTRGEKTMTETITANFESFSTAQNTVDDLLATGIDSEKVYLDDKTPLVKVMVPNTIKPEIMEILKRHQPSQLNETPVS